MLGEETEKVKSKPTNAEKGRARASSDNNKAEKGGIRDEI